MSAGLQFDQYVVVGHWPVVLYGQQIAQSNPIINTGQRIITIDGGGGVKTDGQLRLLPGADHGSLTSGRIGSWGGTVKSGH